MNKLLVKPVTRWYEQAPNPDKCVVSENTVQNFIQQCVQLLEEEKPFYERYKEQSASRSDFRWVDMVRKKGSLQDKSAAFIVLIQDSPIHNLECLDSLIQWVSPKGKRECFMAIDALTDVFIQYLLPPSRKLVPFENRPLDKLDMSKRSDQTKCLVWYFEAQLKKRYLRFLENVEKLSYDNVEASKSKSVKALYTLLCEHPEQEQFLLTRLVNKFGDPIRKIAAKTSHVLSELTKKHPAMKPVVLAEVESLLFRKNIAPKAQYYALCYLSTMILADEEYDLAFKLVQIYLNFFKMCVKAGEADSKLMSVLLTGVNRAHPFCATDQELVSREDEDVLFRLIYMSTLPIAIQCLMLLFQILNTKSTGLSNRFYSALYKKIQDPSIEATHHQMMFFNLIYKAVRRDEEKQRVISFIKRFLQLSVTFPPNLACAMLLIVSHVLKERPQLLLNYPEVAPVEAEEKPRPYDPYTDNPLKTQATSSLCFELLALTKHYHPSVALFATEILNRTSKGVDYFGDPLKDFTLMHFLDRFVYRNPKNQTQEAKDKVFGKSQRYQPTGARTISVGSASYMNRHESTIPVDEAFLYKYFVKTGRRTDGSGVNGKKKGEEVEDLDSDEADEFLDDIDNHNDLDDEEGDFFAGFKPDKDKSGKAGSSDEDSEDEEMEQGMDDDDLGSAAESGQPSDEELEDEADFEMDDDFVQDIIDEKAKKKQKKPKKAAAQLNTEKLQAMLDSNTGDNSLNAVSAKIKGSSKVSDAKQLEWERKQRFKMFGQKRKPMGNRKKSTNPKKHELGKRGTVIKFNASNQKKSRKSK